MPRYLVERYVPDLSASEISAAIERLRGVTDEMAAEGVSVRHVGSTFMPEEEACFCEFEAVSRDSVAAANERAGFAYARIVAVEHLSR